VNSGKYKGIQGNTGGNRGIQDNKGKLNLYMKETGYNRDLLILA
jgi:hypothetical protein